MSPKKKSNDSKSSNKNGIKKLWTDNLTEKDFVNTAVKLHNLDIPKFKPRNDKQKNAYELSKQTNISFFIGKVGSGKTTIAVHSALELISDKNTNYNKVVMLRPVTTTSSEQIGFLKGGMDEKIAPLMLPMKNIFIELIGEQAYLQMVEAKQVEPYALAFIEGLTYKNCVVILDEFQNVQKETLRAVMTRIDDTSKLFICGDYEQIKLDDPTLSASSDIERFRNKPNYISITEFKDGDIVRGKITRVVEECYKNEHILSDKVEEIEVYNYKGVY